MVYTGTKAKAAVTQVLSRQFRGGIDFYGHSIERLSSGMLKRFRGSMQIVFQDPYGSLSPRQSIGQIIKAGLRVHHPEMTAAERRRRASLARAMIVLLSNCRLAGTIGRQRQAAHDVFCLGKSRGLQQPEEVYQ